MSHARTRATLFGGAAIAAMAVGLVGSPSQALQGTDSDAASYPYSAHILVGASDRACSGALVAPQWVLSAKSCFADAAGVVPGKPEATTTVTVGRPDLTQTAAGAVRTATALVAHPDRDLVMVKLSARVNNVQPATLAATPAAAGEELRAAGYGRTKTVWVPDRLHSAAFTAETVSASTIDLAASSDSVLCKGDAGGPVVRVNGTARELVAVASRSWQGGCLGTDPAETRTGAIATRVDDVQPWISSTAFRAQGDMTGDKIADLTAVWDDSTLHSYPGLGNGQLGNQIPLIGGSTWSSIKHLTKGDFTGDGIADLISIWGDGTLHYYQGKGDGTVDTQRAVTLGGDTWLTIRNIAAGDFNKDGIDDLIAIWGDGTLHLYTGKGDGQLNTQVPMIGGTTWSTVKHLTSGDFNKDGVADLKAVWGDGTLHYYSGKGDGTINTQIPVTVGGTTWGSVRQLA